MVYKFFDRNTSGRTVKNEIFLMKSQLKSYTNQLLETLGKEVHSSFIIDNIWSADLADMELISKFHKGIHFILCVVDIYSKYA